MKNNVMAGASFECLNGPAASNKDPMWIDIWDVTDERLVARQDIMYQDAWANGAGASCAMDDTGITLSANPTELDSVAYLSFSTVPDWVQADYEYSYGAKLYYDVTKGDWALDTWGVLPESGWHLEKAADHVKAFYAFDDEGMPFDYAELDSSSFVDLLTEGHEYAYYEGSGDGAYDLARSPELSSASLLLVGALPLGLACWRRRRP